MIDLALIVVTWKSGRRNQAVELTLFGEEAVIGAVAAQKGVFFASQLKYRQN